MASDSAAFRPALIVVDFQEDFCPPNGSLAVESGRDIAPVVNKLLGYPFTVRVATKDWHPADHISFAANHPAPNNVPFTSEVTITNPNDASQIDTTRLWPVHCVQGSSGAELVPELDQSRIDVTIEKGQDKRVEMYSAFADPFPNPTSKSKLESTLKEAGVTHVYCVGLAMDYCVKHTALHAAEAGFKTYVVSEGTKAVSPDDWENAVELMKKSGVGMVSVNSEHVDKVKSLGS